MNKSKLRNPNDHWPQRSLFGSNLESHKLMSNVNYDEFLNGNWKKYQTEKIKKSKSARILGNPALAELRNQLAEEKNRLKDLEVKANNKDNNLISINRINNNNKESEKLDANNKSDFISTSEQNIATVVKVPVKSAHSIKSSYYQYHGNIMDLGRHYVNNENIPPIKNDRLRSKVDPRNAKLFEKNRLTLNEFSEFSDLQLKYADMYKPPTTELLGVYNPDENATKSRIKSSVSSKSSISIDEVPQNIKHRFRTLQTKELLNDQSKVTNTMAHLQAIEDSKKHVSASNDLSTTTTYKRPTSASIDPKSNALYYDLSNYLRHAISHGYPDLKKRSFKEHVHNEDVNKEFLSDPTNYSLQNRRKKDWLGKWTELNVIRERLFKGLELANAERAKKPDA